MSKAMRTRRRSAASGSRRSASVIIRPPGSTTVSSPTREPEPRSAPMSEHGFHVHGPHDHELEHATRHAAAHGDAAGGMINQIAMFTAVIATIGAIFSYMGGA